jgi:hypothetical protein
VAKLDQPEIRLEQLMAKVRAEAEKRGSSRMVGEGGIVASRDDCHPDDLLLEELQPEHQRLASGGTTIRFQLKDEGYHINDFLRCHDDVFVRNAHLGILGRQPDVPGVQGFLALLRSAAMTKVDTLGRLRYSAEGKSHGVRIKGLWPLLLVHCSFHLPFFCLFLQPDHGHPESACYHPELPTPRQQPLPSNYT